MANPNQDVCLSHPNFAVICSFLDRYGEMLALSDVPYKDLQEWIEDARNTHPALIDLHVRLLRRIHKKLSNVTADRWERGVVKFCYKYSDVDAWEIERFGYKLAKVSTKLTLLKNLLEGQFDCNNKFKDKVNEVPPEDMRFKAIGRDKNGISYWYMLDKELNLRVYREDQDDVDSETWELVCRNRDDLATLISNLENGTDTRLMKPDPSDLSDASFKSESVSDANDDSRDSFKQKTPIGPSPLTVKLEPVDPESKGSETKPPIKLKISKAEIDSPSKRLKDRFEKEKGSKLKKIKCKLKEESEDSVEKEGTCNSIDDDQTKKENESEDEENASHGKDEVDGGGDSTEIKDEKSQGSCDVKMEGEKQTEIVKDNEISTEPELEKEIDEKYKCNEENKEEDKSEITTVSDCNLELIEEIDKVKAESSLKESDGTSESKHEDAPEGKDCKIEESQKPKDCDMNKDVKTLESAEKDILENTIIKSETNDHNSASGTKEDETNVEQCVEKTISEKNDSENCKGGDSIQSSKENSAISDSPENHETESPNLKPEIPQDESKDQITHKVIEKCVEKNRTAELSHEKSKINCDTVTKSIESISEELHKSEKEASKDQVQEKDSEIVDKNFDNLIQSESGDKYLDIDKTEITEPAKGCDTANIPLKVSDNMGTSEDKDEVTHANEEMSEPDKDTENTKINTENDILTEVKTQEEHNSENVSKEIIASNVVCTLPEDKVIEKVGTIEDKNPLEDLKIETDSHKNDVKETESSVDNAMDSKSFETLPEKIVSVSVQNEDKNSHENNEVVTDSSKRVEKVTESQADNVIGRKSIETSPEKSESASEQYENEENKIASNDVKIVTDSLKNVVKNSENDSKSIETVTEKSESVDEQSNKFEDKTLPKDIEKETDSLKNGKETGTSAETETESKSIETLTEKNESFHEQIGNKVDKSSPENVEMDTDSLNHDEKETKSSVDNEMNCHMQEKKDASEITECIEDKNETEKSEISDSKECFKDDEKKNNENVEKDILAENNDTVKEQTDSDGKKDIESVLNPVTDNSSSKEEIPEISDTKSTEQDNMSDTSEKKDSYTTRSRKRKKNQLKSKDATGSTTEEEIVETEGKTNITPRKTKTANRRTTRRDRTNKTTDNQKSTDQVVTEIEADKNEEVKVKEDHKDTKDVTIPKNTKISARGGKKKGGKAKTKKDEIVEEIKPDTDGGSTDSESEDKPLAKVRGLIAHSRIGRSKAQKRQAEDSHEESADEPPASKRSKVRGRVTSRGRGKRRVPVSEPENSASSSTDCDDVPLSKVAGRGRGGNSRGRGSNVGIQRNAATPRKSTRQVKKKKFESDEEVPTPIKVIDKTTELNDFELSEEKDTGRRRSMRVRTLRARKKKSPSPEYIPSELEVEEEDLLEYDDDDEFNVKSRKRKKIVEDEIPIGRNAMRFEAKTNKKGKKVQVEENETPCCKCLKSEQPEWILLCDKCDAGYHTACLRPPLMIVPAGDWFCPPCEQTMLLEKLLENLKTLDLSILKSDRLIRRKERLAFVTISLDNVLKEPEPEKIEPKGKSNSDSESGGGSSDSRSSESSGSGRSSQSESDFSDDEYGDRRHKHKSKPRFIQRTCRSKNLISYRFEEFDELIADAIEEDLSVPKEPKPRKVKPPGISRGKDMSNILGESDEENKPKPKPKKRRPRLTELDEEDDDDDDDTDDYELSDASAATDVSKSSDTYVSGEVSDDSMARAYKSKSRRRPQQRRGRGRSRRYKNDFVVDSDFESDEDNTRRSSRKSARRGKVNYREMNSDDTEVEENGSDSFHTSDLDSDSDDRQKKSKKGRDKGWLEKERERPRSGKRQRIKKFSSSDESSEDSEEERTKKKGKKPPRKSARYDSDDESYTEDSEEEERPRRKRDASKKVSKIIDDSETEVEAAETDSSTEVSEEGDKQKKVKTKKNVIRSDSDDDDDEEEDDDNEKEGKEEEEEKKKENLEISHETNSEESDEDDEDDDEEWEEIGAEEMDEKALSKTKSSKGKDVKKDTFKGDENKKEVDLENVEDKKIEEGSIEDVERNLKSAGSEVNQLEEANAIQNDKNKDIEMKENVKISKGITEQVSSTNNKEDKNMESGDGDKVSDAENVISMETTPKVTPIKKKRGRKPKTEQSGSETTTPEVTPKKRGRKPKPKLDTTETGLETQGDEAPVKKKRGRKPKAGDPEIADMPNLVKTEFEENVSCENEKTKTEKDKIDKEDSGQTERKDDSPLSARNKQNMPVGVVKPEVRQGVIVENKQVMDNRMSDNQGSAEDMVSPLQGMKEMAMGNQMIGADHGGFRPYPNSNYPNRNMEGYMGQGFQNYHQQGPYGPGPPGPGSNQPYQGPMQQGPQGMRHGSLNHGENMGPGQHQQYPQNSHGPMSPNSYHQQNQYMPPNMQQGPPPGYYPGHYMQQMGPGGPSQGPQGGYGGYGHQGPPHHGPQSPNYQQSGPPHGPKSPNYQQGGPQQGPQSPNYQPGGPQHGPQSPNYQQGGPQHGPQSPNYQRGPYQQNIHPQQGDYQNSPRSVPYQNQPGHYPMGTGPQGQMLPQQQGPPYQRMPYNYPHMPQPRHPPGFGPNQHPMPTGPGLNSDSPQRPNVRPPLPPQGDMPATHGPTPNPRPPVPHRGFMMDNILKVAPGTGTEKSSSEQKEDNPDEVDDIVKYVTHDKFFKEH